MDANLHRRVTLQYVNEACLELLSFCTQEYIRPPATLCPGQICRILLPCPLTVTAHRILLNRPRRTGPLHEYTDKTAHNKKDSPLRKLPYNHPLFIFSASSDVLCQYFRCAFHTHLATVDADIIASGISPLALAIGIMIVLSATILLLHHVLCLFC